MPRMLIKLEEGAKTWYLEWSTIVDAPITFGMTKEELRDHIQTEYGRQGLEELPQRMERLEKTGTSMHGQTLEGIIACNRAGKGEEHLSKEELIEWYCRKQQSPDNSLRKRRGTGS